MQQITVGTPPLLTCLAELLLRIGGWVVQWIAVQDWCISLVEKAMEHDSIVTMLAQTRSLTFLPLLLELLSTWIVKVLLLTMASSMYLVERIAPEITLHLPIFMTLLTIAGPLVEIWHKL